VSTAVATSNRRGTITALHHIDNPPLPASVWPVTNEASGPARYASLPAVEAFPSHVIAHASEQPERGSAR
jgi:hypothetical protein